MPLAAEDIVYHGVLNASPPRYLRFRGKAPLTMEASGVIGTALVGAKGIIGFGTAQQELWACGIGHATAANSMTLWRTQNQGSSWSQECSRLPFSNPCTGNEIRGNMWGYGDASPGKLWIPVPQQDGHYSVIVQAPDPLNGDPFVQRQSCTPNNGGWAASHGAYSETYGVLGWAAMASQRRYYRTIGGVSWSVDAHSGLPSGFIWNDGIWVDADRNRVYIFGADNTNNWYCYYKPANDGTSAWVQDYSFGVGYFWHDSWTGARHLHGDPITGAVYCWGRRQSNSQCELWRRDPSTGWAMVKTNVAGGTKTALGLWVIDDNNLLASGTMPIQKDDTGYYNYGSGGDIETWPGGTYFPHNSWGWQTTDQDPPIISPVSPYNGEVGVEKDAPISFTVTDEDSGVDFSTIKAWVKGSLVFTDEEGVNGWAATATAITDGYHITLSHTSRLTYFEDGETVGVRADAEDEEGNPGSNSWSFSVTRGTGLRIYPMLFEGVRKADEEN